MTGSSPPDSAGPRRDLSVAVLGVGAIGSCVGADLSLAGVDVTLIDHWPAHVEAMRSNGIQVVGDGGGYRAPKVSAHHLCDVASLRGVRCRPARGEVPGHPVARGVHRTPHEHGRGDRRPAERHEQRCVVRRAWRRAGARMCARTLRRDHRARHGAAQHRTRSNLVRGRRVERRGHRSPARDRTS